MKLTAKSKKVLKTMTVLMVMGVMFAVCAVSASAAGNAPAAGAAGGADGTYQGVMNFILVWVRRLGAGVGLIGAIMFALSFKDGGDAERKNNGLATMISGFIVCGIALAADMFDLFG